MRVVGLRCDVCLVCIVCGCVGLLLLFCWGCPMRWFCLRIVIVEYVLCVLCDVFVL